MEHLPVQATPRGKQSRSALAHMRNSGQTPVSLSGKGMEPISLYVPTSDIHRVLNADTGHNTLVNLTIKDKDAVKASTHVARLAQVNRDPISRQLIAVAFQTISANELQKASIGLTIVGEPQAVRDGAAMLSTFLDHLEVRALPEKMMGSLAVDVSVLSMGEAIRAGDIALPEGFVLLSDPDALVAALQSTASITARRNAEQAAEDKAAADAKTGTAAI